MVVDFRRYSHTQHEGPSYLTSSSNSHFFYGASFDYSTLNAGYECYLIKTSNINFPLWTAVIGLKGHIGAGKLQLKQKLANTLAKSLKSEGYWMH